MIVVYILVAFAFTVDAPPPPYEFGEYLTRSECQEQRRLAIEETDYRWKFSCLKKSIKKE